MESIKMAGEFVSREEYLEEKPERLVALIMLNYRGLGDTRACLASLLQLRLPPSLKLGLYCLDNGSHPKEIEELKFDAEQKPWQLPERFELHFLRSEENLGFAQGNNFLAHRALSDGAQYLFLLNNDTLVAPDLIEVLDEHARRLGEEVILGANIGYEGEREQIWHAGALLDARRLTYQRLHEGALMESLSEPYEVDMIIGCAMWIPAALLREEELFYAPFFLNYEETDFCMRMGKKGIKMMTIPQAKLWHKISRSFESKAYSEYFLTRNRWLWLRRNFEPRARAAARLLMISRALKAALRLPWRALLLALLLLLSALIAWIPLRLELLEEKRRALGRKLAHSSAILMGTWHHFRRRYGPCPPWLFSLLSR